jgi:RHS repeat-associated protein
MRLKILKCINFVAIPPNYSHTPPSAKLRPRIVFTTALLTTTPNLGAPTRATNAAKTLVWEVTYGPNALATIITGGITQNLRQPGQFLDVSTGFYHNGFRDYDPASGRYLQMDPIGLAGGINPYVYGVNNTYRFVDPEGLEVPIIPILRGIIVVGKSITYHARSYIMSLKQELVYSQFHDAGVSEFFLENDTLRVKLECYNDIKEQYEEVLFVFSQVNNLEINGIPDSKFMMIYDDGEVLDFEIIDKDAKILIQWNNFENKISNTKAYSFSFSKIVITDNRTRLLH